MSDLKQFATFYLDGLYLGVEVLKVQEVICYQPITPVPLAPPMIHGLINLRGQILTAIDLRCRFGLPPARAGTLPMNVVVQCEGEAVSLSVDEIGEVVEVGEDCYEAAPETLQGVARELITGVYKMKDRLMLALDTARTVCLPADALPTAEAPGPGDPLGPRANLGRN